MNWRYARQNNISAASTIRRAKKMPSQNNDLALLGMKVKFDNGYCLRQDFKDYRWKTVKTGF